MFLVYVSQQAHAILGLFQLEGHRKYALDVLSAKYYVLYALDTLWRVFFNFRSFSTSSFGFSSLCKLERKIGFLVKAIKNAHSTLRRERFSLWCVVSNTNQPTKDLLPRI